MARNRAAFWVGAIIAITGVSCNNSYAQTPITSSKTNPESCYTNYVSPAVIETVTRQILVKPAKTNTNPQNGQIIIVQPAIYRTKTVQRIVQDRQEGRAEAICNHDMTPELIETLQRAMTTRGHYSGNITGVMDQTTQAALKKAQTEIGIPSNELTKVLAERYGLIIHNQFN